jgi:hypothetical protein
MPRVRFEPMIPVFERAKTIHALDRVATVFSLHSVNLSEFRLFTNCLAYSLQRDRTINLLDGEHFQELVLLLLIHIIGLALPVSPRGTSPFHYTRRG